MRSTDLEREIEGRKSTAMTSAKQKHDEFSQMGLDGILPLLAL